MRTDRLVNERFDAPRIPFGTVRNVQGRNIVVAALDTYIVLLLKIAIVFLPAVPLPALPLGSTAQGSSRLQILVSKFCSCETFKHEKTSKTLDTEDGPFEYLFNTKATISNMRR